MTLLQAKHLLDGALSSEAFTIEGAQSSKTFQMSLEIFYIRKIAPSIALSREKHSLDGTLSSEAFARWRCQ